MDFLKKIFSFVAKYKEVLGYMLLFVVGFLCFLFIFWYNGRSNQRLLEENQIFFQQTTEDLTQMRENYEREKQRLEEINVQHQQEIERLRSDYEERISSLEQRTRARRAEFVRETNGNPQEMADRLTRRLRWENRTTTEEGGRK